MAQLAKLKFNRITLQFSAWQPFVNFEFQGVKKSTGVPALGKQFPIDGDSGGREPFKNATEFVNPDFAGKKTYAERTAAGMALANAILEAARERGMCTAIAISPLVTKEVIGDIGQLASADIAL